MTDKKDTDPGSMNLYQKLAKITGEVGIIAKDGRNQEQKFDFISYANVAGRLRELFAKYGVVIVPRMPVAAEQQRETITSKYDKKGVGVLIDFEFQVVNADQPDDNFCVTWTGEAIDYGDKATNKAATSALKYYLMRQFNISEKGEDPDAESPDRGEIDKPAAASRKPAPSEPTPTQLTAYINELLERRGIYDAADKSTIVLGIADVADKSLLTANKLKAVIKVLRDEDIDKLRSLYLITEDDLAADEPQATRIQLEPMSADDIKMPENDAGDVDLVELAAHQASQAGKHWAIPLFKEPSNGMATLEQQKLIKLWLGQYAKTHPDLAETLVLTVTGKEKVGNYDNAMKVIETLADELNKIADAERAAA